ncbi:MAG: sigma-70 family RNA polymerase sigma factor [Verrucomicrobiota bacterium]
MTRPDPDQTPYNQAKAAFATTHWSVVLAAGDHSAPGAAEALEHLCRIYWYPIYAFVRRLGYAPHDAKDHTQGFFAHLLEKGTLSRAESENGRFRSFLLGALKLYLAESHRNANTQKRGGGATIISIDAQVGEEKYQTEPVDHRTPETLYERNWAETLLDLALARLKTDYFTSGKNQLFERLEPYLAGKEDAPTYAETASALGMSVHGVTSAIFRMRQRYGEHVREAIGETIGSPDELEKELRLLFSALD